MELQSFVTQNGGLIAILVFLGGLIVAIFRLGWRIAIHEESLKKNIEDTSAAHAKIRKVQEVQQSQEVQMGKIATSLEYITTGIDDIRARLNNA